MISSGKVASTSAGLLPRCDASGVLLPLKSLSQRDNVEMLTGPFVNLIATVGTVDPEQRIWLIMDFMGQKARMLVTADQLIFSK